LAGLKVFVTMTVLILLQHEESGAEKFRGKLERRTLAAAGERIIGLDAAVGGDGELSVVAVDQEAQ
jgi:hypothetical protein